jgi:GDP-4-dehydro-6-deoxy-D-mannose reductase
MNNFDQKILITGGTGFAGSHLIEALAEAGYHNLHTTVFRDPPAFIQNLLPEENFHKVDLNNPEETDALMSQLKPEQIYHLASFAAVSKSYGGVREVLVNNIQLQVNLLETVAKHCPTSRILVVGSADGYGLSFPGEIPITELHPFRPVNAYAVSKVSQELLAYSYAQTHQLDVILTRPFNHFGERQSVDFAIPAFISQLVEIERGKQLELKVGDLSGIRDLTYVKDVVQAYILLMNQGVSGQVYNIGSGVGISMQKVVDLLIQMSNLPIEVEVDPERLRPINIPEVVADNAKISKLGWKPNYDFEIALQRTFDWFRNNVSMN